MTSLVDSVVPAAVTWKSQACVERWRSRINPSSFASYWTHLHRFLSWFGKDPENFLAWARAAQDKYDVLDPVQQYVNQSTGKRFATKNLAYASIRSFLVHNRVLLPRDPSFKIHAEEPPAERKLTLENLHELIGLATQPYRSILLVKWMGLLDTEGLIYISHKHAETITKGIRNGDSVIRLTLPGRKSTLNRRPFYTFIGRDAIDSLKEYFERTRGYPAEDEPIWVYNTKGRIGPVTETALTMFWLRLLRRAKLIPTKMGTPSTRYGYNIHNTRDIAISLLNTVAGFNPLVAEFMAGHADKIDRLRYNEFWNIKPDYVLKQYQLAEPYLNIISTPHAADAEEVKGLREEVSQLKLAVRMLQDASGLKIAQTA